MLGTYVFKSCGAVIRVQELWLKSLLDLYDQGDITKAELFSAWLHMHDVLSVPTRDFLEFAEKCLQIVGA